MHIWIRPDKYLRQKFRRQEAQEVADAAKPKPKETVQAKMGNLKLWVPVEAAEGKEIAPSPQEKLLQERIDALLTEKAELRAKLCWEAGCDHKPIVWVREVQFDIKNSKAGINNASVSSADYEGPVPGFCVGHLADGPSRLAQAVYFSRPEIAWGFRPERWFVIFTDGTKQGGMCIQIDPKQQSPNVIEGYSSPTGRDEHDKYSVRDKHGNLYSTWLEHFHPDGTPRKKTNNG